MNKLIGRGARIGPNGRLFMDVLVFLSCMRYVLRNIAFGCGPTGTLWAVLKAENKRISRCWRVAPPSAAVIYLVFYKKKQSAAVVIDTKKRKALLRAHAGLHL
jgi:hypothetical protein